ncbi:hypothetical protein ACFX19_043112 [Malus domestica]
MKLSPSESTLEIMLFELLVGRRLPQAAHDGSKLGIRDLSVVIDVEFLENLVKLGDLGTRMEGGFASGLKRRRGGQ